ncbi:MAG: Sensor histidine kinase RcsC [Gemmatimonadaceae bacterium]|nr:Sensor histidine kinase RcsC [Gemmatimonadaceae bacterium]
MNPDARANETRHGAGAARVDRRDDRLFRALYDYGADAVVILDRDAGIRIANPASRHVFGYPPGALAGKSLAELVHEDDRALVAAAVHSAAVGALGQQVDVAFRTQTRAGHWRLHDATIRGLLSHADVGGLVLTARSVAAQEESLRQLHQAQHIEAIARLAGGVAHDYNNLLTVVSGNAELLLMDENLDDEARGGLEEIVGAAKRAAALTQQLLAFSRRQQLRPEAVSLVSFVQANVADVRTALGPDIELQTDLDPACEPALVDARQLRIALLQLAMNARESMPEGGRLRIETDQVDVTTERAARLAPMAVGRYARLRVLDSGAGMDAATRARVFEPFFTTKERGRGTGLGLAMVYGIVKQSGGFVWVDSVPGAGSAFAIYLPVAGQSATIRAPVRKAPVPAGDSPTTILVVDDDEPVRRMTARSLQRGGYRVLTSADAREALRLATELGEPPDLLVSDVVMPGMNGRDLAHAMRGVHPRLRVLMMSGFPDNAVATPGLDARIPFLQKPFSAEALLATVRRVLHDAPIPE